jgi:hypothetical protein
MAMNVLARRAAQGIAVVLVCAFGLATVTWAQNENGSFSGYVFDAQHGVVPNATVTATEHDKKIPYKAMTDEQGHYSIVDVPPGTYDISVSAAGFKSTVQTGVALHVNDKVALPDFSLTVGTVTETVTVSSEAAAQLDTQGAQLGDTVENTQMENLAVNGRSPLSLVTLTPGVSSQVNVEQASTIGINEFTANGIRNNSNNLTLNGIGDMDTGLNGDQNVTVSQDSIQEFTILTGIYQAQYGRSSGAQINIITKSGTSDFHGSGYIFHRNEGMNAHSYINTELDQAKPLFRFNDAGYTIGGPIYIPGHFNTEKDKLFFFWSEEFQRQLLPVPFDNEWIPTAAELTGNFHADNISVVGPFGPTSLNSLAYTRDPFLAGAPPCNSANTSGCFDGTATGTGTFDPTQLGIIPSSIPLYAPGVKWLSDLNALDPGVLPYGVANPALAIPAGSTYNYTSDLSTHSPRREDLLRMDYDFSSKLRFTGTFIHNSNTSTGFYGGLSPNENVPLATFVTPTPGYQWSVGGTYIISPTLVDDFEVGVSNNSLHNPAPAPLTSAGSGVNLPVLFTSPIQDGFLPSISYGSNPQGGGGASITASDAPFLNFNTDIDATDNVSKVWGQHTFKTGIYVQRSRKNQTSFADANGNYLFGTDPLNPFDTGNGLVNVLLGIVDSFDQADSFLTGRYRYTNIEGYFQDTWKVTPRLTLDLGLRLAWYQPQFDQNDQTSNFFPNLFQAAQEVRLFQPAIIGGQRVAYDATTNTVLPAGDIGAIVPGSGNLTNGIVAATPTNSYLVDNRAPQVGPRVGIAWDITGRGNFVLRTGAGIYYDRIQGNRVFSLIQNPPDAVQPTIHYACINTMCPAGASAISSTSTLEFPPSLVASDKRAKIPTIYEVSFGLETKLPYQMILNTSYVGTFSYQLTDEINLNGIPYGTTFQPQNQDPTLSGPQCLNPATIGFQGTGGYSGACALQENLVRPFPGYGDIIQYDSKGTANYNALQVALTRRFARGLYLGASYTYSKNLSDTTQGLPGGLLGYDFSPERIDGRTKQVLYTYVPFDQRQNLVINYVYSFPSVFKSGWAHNLLDGWQFSGVTRMSTGNPYQVQWAEPGVGGDFGFTATAPIYFLGVPEALTGSYTEVAHIALTGQAKHGNGNSQSMINPGAFAAPTAPSLGLESQRESAYMFTPGWMNFDMSLQKNFALGERVALQLRCDAFNAFNHTQFSGVNSAAIFVPIPPTFTPTIVNLPAPGVPSDTDFGTASAVRDPRELQLVARFVF